jgi:hypothetical protein
MRRPLDRYQQSPRNKPSRPEICLRFLTRDIGSGPTHGFRSRGGGVCRFGGEWGGPTEMSPRPF